MRIQCQTLFDCSYTGVTGHFRISELPFEDRAGQTVTDQTSWNHSRNQQRNWETLLQILGLRAQPQDLVMPVCRNSVWQFEFFVETQDVYKVNGNQLAGLEQDCDSVPMVTGLTELSGLGRTIVTQGSEQNIWFTLLNNTQE